MTEDTEGCSACGAPVADSAHLCGRCSDRLERDLADADVFAAELVTTRLRQSKTGGAGIGVVSRSFDKPLPWDEHAAEVADALTATLVAWARVVADERGIGGPTVQGKVGAWLLRHCEWIRHQPFAAEAADEVQDALRRARSAVDSRAVMAYAGPCRADYHPDEDLVAVASCLQELYVRAGSAYVRCPACRTEHDVAVRQRWLLEQIRDQLAYGAQLSRALSSLGYALPGATMRTWVARDRIVAHGVDLEGRVLYRVADAMDLLVQDAGRTSRRSA